MCLCVCPSLSFSNHLSTFFSLNGLLFLSLSLAASLAALVKLIINGHHHQVQEGERQFNGYKKYSLKCNFSAWVFSIVKLRVTVSVKRNTYLLFTQHLSTFALTQLCSVGLLALSSFSTLQVYECTVNMYSLILSALSVSFLFHFFASPAVTWSRQSRLNDHRLQAQFTFYPRCWACQLKEKTNKFSLFFHLHYGHSGESSETRIQAKKIAWTKPVRGKTRPINSELLNDSTFLPSPSPSPSPASSAYSSSFQIKWSYKWLCKGYTVRGRAAATIIIISLSPSPLCRLLPPPPPPPANVTCRLEVAIVDLADRNNTLSWVLFYSFFTLLMDTRNVMIVPSNKSVIKIILLAQSEWIVNFLLSPSLSLSPVQVCL